MRKKIEELNRIADIENSLDLQSDRLSEIKGAVCKAYILRVIPLAEKTRRNPRYVKITRRLLAPPTEQEARKYWFAHSNIFQKKFEEKEKENIKKIGKRKYELNIAQNRDRIAEEITKREIYPIVKKQLVADYKEIYPRSWKRHLNKMYKPYYKMEYNRIYDNLPGKLRFLGKGEYLIEVFYVKRGGYEVTRYGYPGTSGGRQALFRVGELFAQRNEINFVKTEMFEYTQGNKLRYVRTSNNFVLTFNMGIDERKYPHMKFYWKEHGKG